MCAALFGLMAVCSTIVFSARTARARTLAAADARDQERRAIEREVQVAVRCRDHARDARDRRRPHAPSSCAIARGALRSVRASWNATGDGEIAQRAVGGTSTAKGGTLGESVVPADGAGNRVVDEALNTQIMGGGCLACR